MQIYHQLFQRSSSGSSNRVTSQDTQVVTTEKQQGFEEQTNPVGEKKKNAFRPSAANANAIATAKNAQTRGPTSGSEDGQAHAGLVALAQSSVDGFFDLLQAKVDHSLNAKRRPRMESGASDLPAAAAAAAVGVGEEEGKAGGGMGEEEGDSLDGVALGGVVAAVQQLVSDMEGVDPHVPQVFLAKRAKEFAQEFKRSQVYIYIYIYYIA